MPATAGMTNSSSSSYQQPPTEGGEIEAGIHNNHNINSRRSELRVMLIFVTPFTPQN